LREALLNSGMGFFEIPSLNTREPATAFRLRGKELKVDLLTPMIGKPSNKSIFLKSLNVSATPLRFLEFLLEDVQPAVVVARAGILLNIPSPARYALHKLVISQRREAGKHLKSKKDIGQAEQLLSILIEERPGDILLAFEAAKSRADKFYQQLRKGISLLPVSLQERLNDEM
jgi:hypothetical protein